MKNAVSTISSKFGKTGPSKAVLIDFINSMPELSCGDLIYSSDNKIIGVFVENQFDYTDALSKDEANSLVLNSDYFYANVRDHKFSDTAASRSFGYAHRVVITKDGSYLKQLLMRQGGQAVWVNMPFKSRFLTMKEFEARVAV